MYKVLKGFKGSQDGRFTEGFEKDSEVELSDSLAEVALAEKWVKKIDDELKVGTVPWLKQKLTDLGIEFESSLNKAELESLLLVADVKRRLTALGIEFDDSAGPADLEMLLEISSLKKQLTEKGIEFEDDSDREKLAELLKNSEETE